MRAWWLGFPKFRCPHYEECKTGHFEHGGRIEGVKFVGHFKLPRVKKVKTDENP